MKFLHYSFLPLKAIESREQLIDSDWPSPKPIGFWVTIDGEKCWRTFCLQEDFRLSELENCYEISIDLSNILLINNNTDFDYFTRHYRGSDRYRGKMISWGEVAKEYKGVVISPFLWDRCHVTWYSGWDVASGCIWDTSAIKDFKLVRQFDYTLAKTG